MNCTLKQYKEFISWLSGYELSKNINTISIVWLEGNLKAKMLRNNLIIDLVFEYQKYLEMRSDLDPEF